MVNSRLWTGNTRIFRFAQKLRGSPYCIAHTYGQKLSDLLRKFHEHVSGNISEFIVIIVKLDLIRSWRSCNLRGSLNQMYQVSPNDSKEP